MGSEWGGMGTVKFAGHTMGAPGRPLEDCIDLFAEIGFDGIEVRVAPDGQIDPWSFSASDAENARKHADEAGLEFACLTPYARAFAGSARDEELRLLNRVAEIARELGCPAVRAYGGFVNGEIGRRESWLRTVDALKEAAAFADERGVRLAIETHGGTMALSASEAASMVTEVGRENVGILLDYAWVHLAGRESLDAVLRLALPRIFHVHAKGWILSGEKPQSALLGEGDIPWGPFLRSLAGSGYEGFVSNEYEKHWHAELPDPEIGMRHDLEKMRAMLHHGVTM